MRQITIGHLGHFLLDFFAQIWTQGTVRHILGPILVIFEIFSLVLCNIRKLYNITFETKSKITMICLTSLTRAKCGVPSTLCWKIGKISTSTELFGFNFADNNLKLPNLSIHAFVIIQKSLEVH